MNKQLLHYPFKLLCQSLNVSKSGYYRWRSRSKKSDTMSFDLKNLYWKHHARLVAPSLVHDLREMNYSVSERTVGRRLHQLGLRSKAARKYKVPAHSAHNFPVVANLLNRQFNVQRPNQVWVSDITYIRTQEGWLYLCIILDLFHRKIVGWKTSNRIDRHLVCSTLGNALENQNYPKNVMIHSDQGRQYCSKDFKKKLRRHSLIQSMSRRGNCWDNAVAESFFHTLKSHIVHNCHYPTRNAANKMLFEYIEVYYNRLRRHSANGWLSPSQYEQSYYHSLEVMSV